MTITVEAVPYGREGTDHLRALLAARRGDDPLAPATVIVPRSYVGLSLRRHLASGDGIANVRFVTLQRLAAELGAARLVAGHRPLTDVVLRAAARQALAADAGVLTGVRDHQTTEDAVVDAWRALRDASPGALDRIGAAGSRQADLVRLCRDITDRLHGHIDDRDLLMAARQEVVEHPERAATLGPVIVFMPDPGPALHDDLLAALADGTSVTVLLGVTGDPSVDAETLERAGRFGVPTPQPAPLTPATGTVARSAPSADVEVLVMRRDLTERLAAGLPLDRVAVTFGPSTPYAGLVPAALAQAEIPVVASSTLTLGQTIAGRTLLGALSLTSGGWERSQVVAWIATAPLHHGREPLNAARFDDVSRRAGVTAGLDRWRSGVDRLVAETRAELADDEVQLDEHRVRRLERRAHEAGQVRAFLDDLAGRLTPDPAPSSWRQWGAWSRRLLDDLLGGASARQDWPANELQAFDDIRSALGALGELDHVDPHPDHDRFLRALRAQLNASAPQIVRYGEGVLVGPYRSVVGLDLDVVYVLGVADGAVPTRAADDPLLPDADRVLADGEVSLLTDRRTAQRRAWLAALASAPERVLSYARGDQRNGRDQRPARWFLDAVGACAGRTEQLYGRDLDDPTIRPHLDAVPSHLAAIRSGQPGRPATPDEFDLRELARAAAASPVGGHWLGTVQAELGRGWESRADRRTGAYSRFEGRVRLPELPSPVDTTALSSTRLQTYATCPRRYLLQHVLGVVVPEIPGEAIEAEATTVGTIVHRIMELFILDETAKPPAERIAPDQPWTPAHHERVQEIATQVFDEHTALGVTGHAALWSIRAAAIRRDLDTLLEADSLRRRESRAVPEQAELRFGIDGTPPATIELPDGRALRFKGLVDRVDRTETGGAVVIDYKTGSAESAKELDQDPVKRGQLLQLGVYGLAVQQALGVQDIRASYWFTSQKGKFAQIGYVLDADRLHRFRTVVAALVDGIEAGDFPARPIDAGGSKPGEVCDWCDVKAACPSNRKAVWRGVKERAELAPLLSVIDTAWETPTPEPHEATTP